MISFPLNRAIARGQYGCWPPLSQQPALPSIFHRTVPVFSASYPSKECPQILVLVPYVFTPPYRQSGPVGSGQGLPRGHQQSPFALQVGELSLLAALFSKEGQDRCPTAGS